MKKFLSCLALVLFAASAVAGEPFERKGRHGDGSIRNFGEQYRPKGYVEGFRGGNPAERLESAAKAVLEDSDWGYLECLAAEGDAAADAKISGLLELLEHRAAEGDSKSLYSLCKYYEEKNPLRAYEYAKLAAQKLYPDAVENFAYYKCADLDGYPKFALGQGKLCPLIHGALILKRYDVAENAVKEFARLHPQNGEEIMAALVKLSWRTDDKYRDMAVDYAKKMQEENPFDLRYAAIVHVFSKFEAGREWALKYLDSAETELEKYEMLAFAHKFFGDDAEYEKVLLRAAELGSGNAEIYFNLAILLSRGGHRFYYTLLEISDSGRQNIPQIMGALEKAYGLTHDCSLKLRVACSVYWMKLKQFGDYKSAKGWLLKACSFAPMTGHYGNGPLVDLAANYALGVHGFERDAAKASRVVNEIEISDNGLFVAANAAYSILNNKDCCRECSKISDADRHEAARILAEDFAANVKLDKVSFEYLNDFLNTGLLSDEGVEKLFANMEQNPQNMFCHAFYLFKGNRNLTRALELLKASAERGNAAAMLLLFGAYYGGKGVDANIAAADIWLEKSLDCFSADGISGAVELILKPCFNDDGMIKHMLNAAWARPALSSSESLAEETFKRNAFVENADKKRMAEILEKHERELESLWDCRLIFNIRMGEWGEFFVDEAKAAVLAKKMYESPKNSAENKMFYPLMLFYGRGMEADREKAAEMLAGMKDEKGEPYGHAAGLLVYFHDKGLCMQKDPKLLEEYRGIAGKNSWGLAFDFGGLREKFYRGLFPADEEVAAKYYELYLEQSKTKSSGE